jgi:hypothetical protein
VGFEYLDGAFNLAVDVRLAKTGLGTSVVSVGAARINFFFIHIK